MSLTLFNRNLAKCGKTISIQKRNIKPAGFSSSSPTEEFIEIATPKCIIKTTNGVKSFSGVQVANDATHMFCMEYDVALAVVDQGNYFMLFNDRRFRIIDVTNINELDKVIVIQSSERGDKDLAASES